MKNLLLTLILLASSSVFGKSIAHYRFAIGSNDWRSADQATVINASLTDKGSLVVLTSSSADEAPQYWEETLHEKTFESMKWNVLALSNVEIKETIQAIVCAMMPGPLQSNDHLSVRRGHVFGVDDFFGEMKLVHGPQGCWVARKITPVGGRNEMAARLLKEQMKIAALELIKL